MMVSQDALPPSSASDPRDAPPRRFQFTGSLLESSFYVERPADRLLPEALLDGRYCHILAPRQIGKSSLRVRTARTLAERGIRCASVDLTAVGTAGSEDEWFFGLTEEISRRLRADDPVAFWEEHRHVAPARRFGDCLRRLLKTELGSQRVVIFLDEIEAVRLASFGLEDFFLTIRALHEERSEDADLRRLTFCLIGVTTPNDLVKNKTVTPFNISEAIPLDDFTRTELDALAPGLDALGAQASALLDTIYAWTDGHPYMTMRACAALAGHARVAVGAEHATVDEVMRREFLERPLEDPNLNYAARRFEDASFGRPGAMLTDKILLYRSLLLGEDVAADTESAVQMELRLCGMVKDARTAAGRELKLRNRIFSTALDMEWLKSKGERRFIAEAVWKWIESGRDEDALLRGVVLEDALRLAKTAPLSDDERAFLDASQRRETAELGLKRASIQTEVRQVELELAEIAEDKARVEREKEQAEQERAALQIELTEVRRRQFEAEEKRRQIEESTRLYKRRLLLIGLPIAGMLLLGSIALGALAQDAAQQARVEADKARDQAEEARAQAEEQGRRQRALEEKNSRLEADLIAREGALAQKRDEEAKVKKYIEENKDLVDRLTLEKKSLQTSLKKATEELARSKAERAQEVQEAIVAQRRLDDARLAAEKTRDAAIVARDAAITREQQCQNREARRQTTCSLPNLHGREQGTAQPGQHIQQNHD
ncbi:AAA-like domain-containing protein [Sorangium sp. KYC3313]|uniref:AAA-like domain-containing protein n=1 Tax=Sorangium sp. KYC3313 TaxID=3449740 RepID=UPI003F895B19